VAAVPVAPQAEGAPLWDALGRAMHELLVARPHRRGDRGEIDVLLSESLCRFALVRGGPTRLAADEAEALARHNLPPAGAGAAGEIHRIAAVDGADGTPRLLCAALEQAGLARIGAALADSPWTLRSLAPRLVDVLAGLGRQLHGYTGHLVCADPRVAVLVALREGGWLQVMSRRTLAESEAADGGLQQMLAQSEALAGTGSRALWWCGVPPPALPGWELSVLPDGGALP
jgi:hypothetical protein